MRFLLILLVLMFSSSLYAYDEDPGDLHINELKQRLYLIEDDKQIHKKAMDDLHQEIKANKDRISDFEKASEEYRRIARIKKECDEGNCKTDPFGLYAYEGTEHVNQIVEDSNIRLSNGFVFDNYGNLEAYVKRTEKDQHEIQRKLSVAESKLAAAKERMHALQREHHKYLMEVRRRRSQSAIEGYWKFDGQTTVLRIESTPAGYRAIVTEDSIDKFSRGDALFVLSKADVSQDKYYYTGKEYAWGKSQIRLYGDNPPTINIRVKVRKSVMYYRSRDDDLRLTRVGRLD